MEHDHCTGYLHDLGLLIREKALEAKRDRDVSSSDADRAYNLGRSMALYEVVSLMQQQAQAFNVSLTEIGLADIDPEKDLL